MAITHNNAGMPPYYCMHHVAMLLAAACTMSPCSLQLHALPCLTPCSCMHCLASPLVAACTASPCPSWLHAPCRCACVTVLLVQAYPLLVLFLFSFSANFFFCSPVTVLSPPSLLMDAQPSSPSRACHNATTNHDNNATTMMTAAVAPTAQRQPP